MPRFAILTHDHPFVHWDFLLEQHGTLRTWRLLEEPDASAIQAGKRVAVAAEALADHRLEYLDYEGEVSGGRGEVRRWDRGEYQIVDDNSPEFAVRLSGTMLNCRACLQADASSTRWVFEAIVY